MSEKKSAFQINLPGDNVGKGLDLLFQNDPTLSAPEPGPDGQKIVEVEIPLIDDHPNQGRWSMDENELNWLANNIAEVGVLQPVSLMLKPDGRYLLMAGHRRKEGAKRAGLKTLPAMVDLYNERRAKVVFNATNLGQRAKLRPSEKALAYLDLEEAVKNGKKTTAAIVKLTGDNAREIQRYKRLVNLDPALLAMIDAGTIPLYAGVELAGLCVEDQVSLLNVLANHRKNKVSLKQASQLVEASGEIDLDEVAVENILFPQKPARDAISLKLEPKRFSGLIPEGMSKAETLDLLQKALAYYSIYGTCKE